MKQPKPQIYEFVLQEQRVRGEGTEYIVWSRKSPSDRWDDHDHPDNDWTTDKRKAIRLMKRLEKEQGARPVQPKPQVGDIWEVRRPGRRKKVKEIGNITKVWVAVDEGSKERKRMPWIGWRRQNKGRYTGILVHNLLLYGKRLSTQAERKAAQDARWKEKGIIP